MLFSARGLVLTFHILLVFVFYNKNIFNFLFYETISIFPASEQMLFVRQVMLFFEENAEKIAVLCIKFSQWPALKARKGFKVRKGSRQGTALKVRKGSRQSTPHAKTACFRRGDAAGPACCFCEETFRLLYRNFMNPPGRGFDAPLLNGCQRII